MKRTILSLILCCALLFSLAACGKTEAPQPTASAGTETAPNSENPAAAEGISYADAYAQYTAIYGALLNAVQQRLDTHDARLQAAYPDSYYMNSDYLLLVYVPVHDGVSVRCGASCAPTIWTQRRRRSAKRSPTPCSR